jgi:moderate conductance mechanosensitive channel
MLDFINTLPTLLRVPAILFLALAAHLLVRALKEVGQWVMTPAGSPRVAKDLFERRHPRVATITSLVVSAATFSIYFLAVGLALREVGADLRTYFATATVVGLAVGFGSQGLVQDVVSGLTLIFSDAFDIGDMVELSGQIGRVEKMGLRFTTLVNLHGQTVYVPNRNITVVGRYRRGAIRAYLDVQLPDSVPEEQAVGLVVSIARAARAQHPALIVSEPEPLGVFGGGEGGWRYARIKFRLWPGQGALVETAVRQRIAAALRALDPAYADWMIAVTYRLR